MVFNLSRKRRFLALWLPYLPAERWQMTAATPPDPSASLVLTEKVKGALRVAASNAAASACGLLPGLSLADARARFPALHAVEIDHEGDAALLTRLAGRLLMCSPIVAEDPPDGLLLDISGCAHLFGGEDGLLNQAIRLLAPFTVRAAFAAHPDSARAIARWGNPGLSETEAISALPLAALELDEDATRALRRAGLTSISMVRTRSMASLASRFGGETVRALRRLYGEESRPLVAHEEAPLLSATRHFAELVGKTEHILDIARDMMGELSRALLQKHEGGRAFRLSLFRSDGDVRSLIVETGQPTRDPALIERLLRERIDHLADPLDPGFGYDMLRLMLLRSEPLPPQQIEEDGKVREREAVSLLLDRLTTRHGAEALRYLVPCDSYIPERAQIAVPVTNARKPQNWDIALGDEPPSRPLWLLDPPEKVEVMAEVPDGPPRWFRWRDSRHDVILAEGPERIAGEWWRAPLGHWPGHGAPGQAERTRDYYRIEDKDGHRFWLFRAGLYNDESDRRDPLWYVHGLFA